MKSQMALMIILSILAQTYLQKLLAEDLFIKVLCIMTAICLSSLIQLK